MTHREEHTGARRGAIVASLVGLAALCTAGIPVAQAAASMRVATLLPYVEDALDRMGSGVVIVATVRRALGQPPPANRTDLGTPHAPNLEALAVANPQLVVGDKALHGPLRDALARSGAEVLLIDGDSVDATFEGLLEVGRVVGTPGVMAREVGVARTALLAERLADPLPTLLVFGTPGNFLVVSERTWLGDLLRTLDFRNVGAGSTGQERHPGFVQVSDEVMAGMRPELVLLVAHGDPIAIKSAFTDRLDGGAWSGLRKAATRGVQVLPPALFSVNPGLGLPVAAKRLRELAAPRLSRRP